MKTPLNVDQHSIRQGNLAFVFWLNFIALGPSFDLGHCRPREMIGRVDPTFRSMIEGFSNQR
jgi:hypothetical protein